MFFYEVSSQTCGTSIATISRVVGGTNATEGAWPWQVELQFNGFFICGGAIIDPTTIITAAHCVEYLQSSTLSVRAGECICSFTIWYLGKQISFLHWILLYFTAEGRDS